MAGPGTYMYVCMYVCMYVYIYIKINVASICIYTYTIVFRYTHVYRRYLVLGFKGAGNAVRNGGSLRGARFSKRQRKVKQHRGKPMKTDTLQYTNMAMTIGPFINDLPI